MTLTPVAMQPLRTGTPLRSLAACAHVPFVPRLHAPPVTCHLRAHTCDRSLGWVTTQVISPSEGVPAPDAPCNEYNEGFPSKFDFRRLGGRTTAMLMGGKVPNKVHYYTSALRATIFEVRLQNDQLCHNHPVVHSLTGCNEHS